MTAKRANLSKPTSSPRRALAPPLATAELLKDMYARMLRARSLADTNPVTILEQRPTSSEAVTVGVGVELKAGDTLSADRHHLIEYLSSIAEGTDEHARWLKSARGSGNSGLPARMPRGGAGIIPPDSEGRAQVAVAVGAAHSFRTLGQTDVAVILAGSNMGRLLSAFEAIRLAAESKLPVVLVVETSFDLNSTNHHGSLLRSEDLGFPRIPVDGNDSVAVHRIATEAIQRARQGDGPTLIDCQMAGRNKLGLAQDGVAHMRSYLRKHQLWSARWSSALEAELEQLKNRLAEAISQAKP